tara:strand:- start:57 stop:278 length:222 start_codon:yes stop_codon:yes gene_type:complete
MGWKSSICAFVTTPIVSGKSDANFSDLDTLITTSFRALVLNESWAFNTKGHITIKANKYFVDFTNQLIRLKDL